MRRGVNGRRGIDEGRARARRASADGPSQVAEKDTPVPRCDCPWTGYQGLRNPVPPRRRTRPAHQSGGGSPSGAGPRRKPSLIRSDASSGDPVSPSLDRATHVAIARPTPSGRANSSLAHQMLWSARSRTTTSSSARLRRLGRRRWRHGHEHLTQVTREQLIRRLRRRGHRILGPGRGHQILIHVASQHLIRRRLGLRVRRQRLRTHHPVRSADPHAQPQARSYLSGRLRGSGSDEHLGEGKNAPDQDIREHGGHAVKTASGRPDTHAGAPPRAGQP